MGKSFLLSRFCRQAGGLYYQATRRTEAEQLATLSRVVGERFADTALLQGVAFPDWERLLAYVVARAAGEPFLLVLDEFPYLVDSAPALPSILQAWLDHAAKQGVPNDRHQHTFPPGKGAADDVFVDVPLVDVEVDQGVGRIIAY